MFLNVWLDVWLGCFTFWRFTAQTFPSRSGCSFCRTALARHNPAVKNRGFNLGQPFPHGCAWIGGEVVGRREIIALSRRRSIHSSRQGAKKSNTDGTNQRHRHGDEWGRGGGGRDFSEWWTSRFNVRFSLQYERAPAIQGQKPVAETPTTAKLPASVLASSRRFLPGRSFDSRDN